MDWFVFFVHFGNLWERIWVNRIPVSFFCLFVFLSLSLCLFPFFFRSPREFNHLISLFDDHFSSQKEIFETIDRSKLFQAESKIVYLFIIVLIFTTSVLTKECRSMISHLFLLSSLVFLGKQILKGKRIERVVEFESWECFVWPPLDFRHPVLVDYLSISSMRDKAQSALTYAQELLDIYDSYQKNQFTRMEDNDRSLRSAVDQTWRLVVRVISTLGHCCCFN